MRAANGSPLTLAMRPAPAEPPQLPEAAWINRPDKDKDKDKDKETTQ